MLSLDDLQLIVVIVESETLTRAAARLGVSLNVVSRRLARLEAAAGVRLVERTTRSRTVTEAGEELYRNAQGILEQLEWTEAALERRRQQVEGRVRVVLPPASVSAPLLGRLRELLAVHPALQVDLSVTETTLRGGGDVDLAVALGEPEDRVGVVARRVHIGEWRLSAAPAYAHSRGLPAAPVELARHACLRFRRLGERQDTWTLLGPGGERVVVPVGGSFECDDSRVLGDATYAGLGIGVRPARELAAAAQAGTLLPVLPGWAFAQVPVYLLSPRGRSRLPSVRTVAAAVMEALSQTL